MIAKEEICIKCGKTFVSEGVFPERRCEQCRPTKLYTYKIVNGVGEVEIKTVERGRDRESGERIAKQ